MGEDGTNKEPAADSEKGLEISERIVDSIGLKSQGVHNNSRR